MADRRWFSTVSEEDAWIRSAEDVWMCARCGFEGYGLEPHDCAAELDNCDEPPTRPVGFH